MQKITPHLWFNTEAKEAAELYTSLFSNSSITSVRAITGTPSGDCDMVAFTLSGKDFMAISAGPYFSFNPSISLFVTCDSEEEIKATWDKLADGGKVLMEYNTYPWAQKYGWLQDKYGLSWQLSLSEHHKLLSKITPMCMFTNAFAGKAKDAILNYTNIFPNSHVEVIAEYAAGEGDKEGDIKHTRFTLCGEYFMAMDSSAPHAFTFNEAISFIIHCDTQEEIDTYWERLSHVPEAEQCGWLKDKYGMSWQVVPREMDEMMAHGTKEQIENVTKAFLSMKKFDIKKLHKAYNS